MDTRLFDDVGRPKRVIAFSGRVYSNSNQEDTPGPRRFETQSTRLPHAVIHVQENDILFGNAGGQDALIPKGTTFTLTNIDLALLWFRSADPHKVAKVSVLGTLE